MGGQPTVSAEGRAERLRSLWAALPSLAPCRSVWAQVSVAAPVPAVSPAPLSGAHALPAGLGTEGGRVGSAGPSFSFWPSGDGVRGPCWLTFLSVFRCVGFAPAATSHSIRKKQGAVPLGGAWGTRKERAWRGGSLRDYL